MIVFYTDRIDGDIAVLPPQEARHCTKVLRKKEGDVIRFTDGKGSWYKGEIEKIAKDLCRLRIISSDFSKRKYPEICIGIALTKNIQRFEWFVEKATELGVAEISPIICDRSERKVFKIDRTQRIVLSALKQSLGSYLPRITPAIQFEDYVESSFNGLKCIANLSTNSRHIIKVYDGMSEVNCIIGPEGDFSSSEIEAAIEKGFKQIALGENRLRTETAGVIAVNFLRMQQELKM